MIDWESSFGGGLTYGDFLEQYGTPEQRRRWSDVYDAFSLTGEQETLLASFTREMHVLCLAGAWCGDCANQCPIFHRFAEVASKIELRFLDRDAMPAVSGELTVCGGGRVPVVVFLSEDNQECGRYGDRTLTRYRAMASEQIGAACPTGLAAGTGAIAESAADWLREFERFQLMLRLSPRLRSKHGD